MSARPGEENVATLFGDIHYFYSPETARPQHHRFDKGSYVYLYENASTRRARVEIANQAGTDDQDAFDGYLDHVRLRYSHKHHCLVSLSVVANPLPNAQEWHLPTYDPRNENKYHYPLHSLDIYFWTRADALQFVNGARRVLPPAQCDILHEPASAPQSPAQGSVYQQRPPPQAAQPVAQHGQQPQAHPPSHDGPMNAVVQRLENAAISRQGSNGSAAPSFAPPPGSENSPSSTNFAPMAYNPAAPAAPEAIRHREKTPPPPQDPSSDPRIVAAAYENGQAPFTPANFSPAPFSPFLMQHHQQPLASPAFPHQQHPLASPGFAPAGYGAGSLPPPPPPPGPPGQPQRVGTMPTSPMPPGTAGLYPGSPGFAPQGMQSMHPGAASPPQQQQQSMAPPPTPQGQGQGQGEYGLHHQVYRPEGAPAPAPAPAAAAAAAAAPGKAGKGRLEENAGRLERGVSGMLKKFEKKFG